MISSWMGLGGPTGLPVGSGRSLGGGTVGVVGVAGGGVWAGWDHPGAGPASAPSAMIRATLSQNL
jgi:hypothetical protein